MTEPQICKYCNENVGREYGVIDLLGRPISIEAHYKRCDERQKVIGGDARDISNALKSQVMLPLKRNFNGRRM